MRRAWREYGINVYEIRPGVIETDMTGGVKEKYDAMIEAGAWPLKRWGQPVRHRRTPWLPSRAVISRFQPAKFSTWMAVFICALCSEFPVGPKFIWPHWLSLRSN